MIKKKRSGLSCSRSYRIQEHLKTKIVSIFADVHFSKSTSEILNEKINILMDCSEAQRIPRHVRAYLQGYIDASRDDINRNHLVWLKSCDGTLLTSQELNRITAYEETILFSTHINTPWARVNSDLSRYVWKDDQGNPLRDKPFDAKFL